MEIKHKLRFFVPVLWVLGGYVSSFAADKDGFSLSVEPGTPAALPRLASIGEKVTFRFSIIFKKGDQRLEKLPPEVIGMEYHLICDGFKTPAQQGTIRAVEPLMTINADGKTAELKGRVLLLDILAVADFPTDGNHYLLLWVKAIFRDGSFLMFPPQQATLQQIECATIHVPVTDATFTIYACPPEVRKIWKTNGFVGGLLFARHFYGDVGHSFWKIGIDPKLPESQIKTTWDGILVKDKHGNNVQKFPPVTIANRPVGFYPQGGEKEKMLFAHGHVYSDEEHYNNNDWYSSKSYHISIAGAKKAIDETVKVCGHEYLAISKLESTNMFREIVARQPTVRNCTGQATHMAKVANCLPPDGVGLVVYHPQVTYPLSRKGGIPLVCPNPYVHAVDLRRDKGIINPQFSGKPNDLDK